MNINRIFTEAENGKLWAVCYPEDGTRRRTVDVFEKLMHQWSDTEFLTHYFIDHIEELENEFWDGLTPDQAIDQVMEERYTLEEELLRIETGMPGYEHNTLDDIFLPLHQNIYALNFKNESFKKAKANVQKPMIRLYAIRLDDGTMIITGGAIKLSKRMEGDIFLLEKKRLNQLKGYLQAEKITDEQGLL